MNAASWPAGRMALVAGLYASVLLAACGGSQRRAASALQAPPARAGAATGAASGEGEATQTVPTLAERMPLPSVLEEAETSAGATAHDDGLDGAWARVFLRANPGPFQYVAYEISARGGAAVVSHLRGVMGRRDAVIRTELVDRAVLQRVMAALAAMGAATMAPPTGAGALAAVKAGEPRMPSTSARPIYELTYRRGGVERTVTVVEPMALDDGLYARFIALVRSQVIAAVGDISWHGPDAEGGGAKGYLFIDSVPSADVFVDDEKLPERTPVLNWTLAPGVHRVRLERGDLGLSKTTSVRIEAGLTTTLELDLR